MVDFVFVTKIDHLYSLKLSIKMIYKLYSVKRVFIVTNKKYFKYFKFNTPVDLILIDEEEVLPQMNLDDLRKMNLPYFPQRAGWYFQQLLKLGVSKFDFISENYVIVDADTIFLNKTSFINESGKFVFLKADEYHSPYFDNYRKLLGEDAKREFSFISQYMVFNKTIVKDLFRTIEKNYNNNNNWNWLIINNLVGSHASLFSEYETYGNFIKNHYPERCFFESKSWLREGSELLKTTYPTQKDLDILSKKYILVSFELKSKTFFAKVKRVIFHKLYPLFSYLYYFIAKSK